MKHIKNILTVVVILLSSSLVHAEQRPSIATESLFQNMVGNWEGEGWTMLGPNQRVEFTQTESVTTKTNGHVVVVEGTGKNKETGEEAFQAYGIFNYDLANNKYQFTAYQMNGYSISVEPKIDDEHFVWEFDSGRGLIRYTANITKTNWSQIGEFSANGGKTWFKNFEMKLEKIK